MTCGFVVAVVPQSRVIMSQNTASSSNNPAKSTENDYRADESLCDESFRPSVMAKVFCFHWLVSIGIVATAVYLTVRPLEILECNTYYVIVYLQLGFWAGTYMVNEYIKPSCRKMVNQRPALARKMATYRTKPLQIVSFWNTALILTQQFATEKFKFTKITVSKNCDPVEGPPQVFIIFFSGLQTVALSLFYIPALGNGYISNIIKTRPVVKEPEESMVYLLQETRNDKMLEPKLEPRLEQHIVTVKSLSAWRPKRTEANDVLDPPKPLAEASLEEQLRAYAGWYRKTRAENKKLWRQARKLGIKREDLHADASAQYDEWRFYETLSSM